MRFQISGAVVISLIFMAATFASGQGPAVAKPQPAQSSGKSVAGPARIPDNYADLAKYFQEVALQEQALAKSHEHIAKMYEQKVLPVGLDPASAREVKNQYRRLAETERKAAEAAVKVAAYHARLAGEMGSPPAAPKRANPQDAAFRR